MKIDAVPEERPVRCKNISSSSFDDTLPVYQENIPDNRRLSNGVVVMFAVTAYVPSLKCCEPDVIVVHVGLIELENVMFCRTICSATEAVVANELDMELLAQLLVPVNVPVNEPVNEPVLICVELETSPFGSMIGAYEALIATDDVAAYEAEVAVSAKVAYEELATDPDCATVTENCDPSPFVNVMVVLDTLAVTTLLIPNDADNA